jgi:uracil-DNA glycosylase
MQARLAHETDLAGFRRNGRALLLQGVPPEQVAWTVGEGGDDLFAHRDLESPDTASPARGSINVPAAFVSLCEAVVLHRDPQRFALLYRLLWRLVREPALRHDPLDPDLLQARQMARAVGRDVHKMRAFVRFRPVADRGEGAEPLHVAWFEPEHRIVAANAPWFSRRFANMRWAILSPDACAEWDGERLVLRGGARREEAPPPDAGEALWLTYYRSIFNPARLNLPMLAREMPRRYWRNLPEAQAIPVLAAAAQERSARMIEEPPTTPARRLPRPPAQVVAITPADALQRLHGGMQS